MSVSLATLIACASTQPTQKSIESVDVKVPLEVSLSFVPRLMALRIDYRDSDGQPGLTSEAEIYQVIPTYWSTPGNNIPEPLSSKRAYGIYLMSKK